MPNEKAARGNTGKAARGNTGKAARGNTGKAARGNTGTVQAGSNQTARDKAATRNTAPRKSKSAKTGSPKPSSARPASSKLGATAALDKPAVAESTSRRLASRSPAPDKPADNKPARKPRAVASGLETSVPESAAPLGRLNSILDELRGMGSERNRQGMARYGINVKNAFGVSVYELRKIAQRLGPDHDLALALWASRYHEARILACFVDDPAAVTPEQLEAWAREFDSWDLCDQATTSLFDSSTHAWAKAVEWARRDEEWVKRAGFAMMAGLAVHDKLADDAAFVSLLPFIEQGAFDDRNFVKKAVNWALRNIGKRNAALHTAAIRCAERIRAAANDRAGADRGGDPALRAARWVAADALRELTSDKAAKRVAQAEARRKKCDAAMRAKRSKLPRL